MSQGKQWIGSVMVAVVVALAGCKGGHEEKSAPELPVVQVGVQLVEEVSVGSQIEVVGTIRTAQRASIAARVSGQIVDLPVVLGSQVQKGDLLVRISAGEISAQVLQAQAQVEQARRNLAREESLQKKEASTRETVKSLQDQARIAEAAHKEVKTMLEFATITAPFAGTVTRKIASVGDLASPGVVLLELENEKELQVVAQVPEGLILKVRKGDVLSVFVPAAGVTLSGEVAEVAPAADPFSRTAPVKINIAAGTDLRSGQFARVTLTGSGEKSLAISEKAVLSFGQMERVFLVEDAGHGGPSVAGAGDGAGATAGQGRPSVAGARDGAGATNIARLRLVRTGMRADGQVEILAGLVPGDRVVVNGTEKLQDGQPLDVQPLQPTDGSVPLVPRKEKERP